MSLEIIMLSEISKTEEDKYYMFCLHMESNEQNKLTNNIETEAWLHRTDWQLSEENGEGKTGWKKVKGLTKEYVCITHRHRPQCSEGQREGGEELGGGGQRGEMEISVYSVNYKN